MGRKPKSDPAVHRYVVRLNSEENGRFNIQFQKSGLKEHSNSLKERIGQLFHLYNRPYQDKGNKELLRKVVEDYKVGGLRFPAD